MSLSPRQPLRGAFALLLPLLLILGLWLGGHPEHLPGFLRDAFVADHQTRVVDEAIERVAHDYYRQIPTAKLSSASISGLVASLGDRFSHYLTPSEYREFNSPPHFTGIGVAVAPEAVVGRGLQIARVFDSSPAQRAGLKVGDAIVAVGSRALKGLSQDAATALIKGLPGTDVVLEIEGSRSPHGGAAARRRVKITRATISEPVVASLAKTVHGVKLGVVALATFSPGAHGEVRQVVEHELHAGARGIVLDLRGNGGGLVSEAQLIASIFIAKGTIVLAILFITLRVLGRNATGVGKRGGKMEVLESRTLAAKASLHLVAVGDRRLVVGLTPSGMVSLAELDAAELETADADAALDAAAGSSAGRSAISMPTLASSFISASWPLNIVAGKLSGLFGGRIR